MRKTKRRIRKHNYLGKAKIKNYSIKKGGVGRWIRSRSNMSNRSNRNKISSNILSKSALARMTADYARQAAEAKAKQEAGWDAERKQGFLGLALGIQNATKRST